LGVFAGPPSVNENCLYLNVFTPNTRRHHGKGLPVFVWLHGGGNVDGESNDYDGTKLATGGQSGGSNTVVVTLNYRLGLFGFLANSALDSEGHNFGNYGIMDQQAALRWVKRNIAAFGGNPDQVTMGGQSAGAQDTDLNVVSPLAAHLFNGGISESGFSAGTSSLASAVSKGDAFANAAGCTGTGAGAASCLRSLTVPQILQLQGTPNANGPFVNGPMVDGTVVPRTPTQAWTSGQYNHMPMMGGRVEDEGDFGIGISEYFSGPPMTPVTAEDYTNFVTNTYGANADKVLARYPLSSFATPQQAEDRVMTDPEQCGNLTSAGQIAQTVPTYDYTFNYQNAPYYFPAMPGFAPLAAHTSDIQFLFPLWHGGPLGVPHPLNGPETTLSNELVAAWTNFAATGNPNGTGNSPWPRFDSTAGAPSVLDENVPNLSALTVAQTAGLYNCDFWSTIS
jgi:para-nitrobenzyl esterase